MTALPKLSVNDYPTRTKRSSSRPKNSKYKTQVNRGHDGTVTQEITEKTTQTLPHQIAQFPPIPKLPTKLKQLIFWQKTSLGLAFSLIAASIAVYVANVRIPEIWSQKYEQLETLQRQERELTATNESLKHKLAQQAEDKENNLQLANSNNTIFISPASLPQPKSKQKQPEINLNKIPMGY